MKEKKGIFVVFEGPDRSGKTTQINLLKKKLKEKKIPFIITREPGGTPLAEKIRKILLSPKNHICPMSELLLYEAARAQHVNEKIMPALNSGKVVISDRFYLATIAYQGYGRKLDIKTIKLLNRIATDNLRPDLTFLFLMPDSEFKKRRISSSRGDKIDRIERENEKFRKKVNAAYRKIAKSEKNIIKINATSTIKEINEKIKEKIFEKI
jgi:dTMP kinase